MLGTWPEPLMPPRLGKKRNGHQVLDKQEQENAIDGAHLKPVIPLMGPRWWSRYHEMTG